MMWPRLASRRHPERAFSPAPLARAPHEALIYDFDEASQLIEDDKTGGWVELTGRRHDRDVFPGIAEANIRCVEADRILVGFQKSAYSGAEGARRRMLASSTIRLGSVTALVSLANV
jgi:hypothetical protein